MKKIVLQLGRFDSERTLFHILSIEFEIEPKIYTLDAFSAFLQTHGGFHIEIRAWDKPYGVAAKTISKIFCLFEKIKTQKGSEFLDYIFLPREEVILDFRTCRNMFSVYDEMRNKMEWEDWYGTNLSALWDILTGLPYRGDDFLILRPRQYHEIPYGQDSEFTSGIDELCEVFLEAQEKYGEITVQIQYSEEQNVI